jgi:hypothetical protein
MGCYSLLPHNWSHSDKHQAPRKHHAHNLVCTLAHTQTYKEVEYYCTYNTTIIFPTVFCGITGFPCVMWKQSFNPFSPNLTLWLPSPSQHYLLKSSRPLGDKFCCTEKPIILPQVTFKWPKTQIQWKLVLFSKYWYIMHNRSMKGCGARAGLRPTPYAFIL